MYHPVSVPKGHAFTGLGFRLCIIIIFSLDLGPWSVLQWWKKGLRIGLQKVKQEFI